ncbi:MAG: patatin-like phospholipase family protein [Leptolyngbyaceae cyanobacterium]
MTTWNPSSANITRLTSDQVAKIQSKLAPPVEGRYYADAVFEGGGVKGTAFLGALRCFDDAGIHLRKVAGTSAGAITAAMVAAGFAIDELETIIGQLDYEAQFLSQKTSRLIFNGSPDDDLQNPVWMLANLFAARQMGQYSSEPFKEWLSTQLATKAAGTPLTFGMIANRMKEVKVKPEEIPWPQQRAVKVVVSDISRGEMLVLPDDLPPLEQANFSVAEAVRLSMSIPFFFEPGQLKGSMIVDGGILSNFPLWIYDAEPGRKPRCPTFGFQLVNAEDEAPRPIEGVADLVVGMFATMQSGRDRRHQRENDQGRIIDIDTLGISTTDFGLSNEDKSHLYQKGYESTKAFLLNQWSWQAHLEARGFKEKETQFVT